MFSLMGNCFSCVKSRHEPRKAITLIILGLDGAGKTTTTKDLIGDTDYLDSAPTVGFSSEKFKFVNYDITLYDLGGGKKIRDIWKSYFSEVYGIVYVIDSTIGNNVVTGPNAGRMKEAKENFRQILEHQQVAGKPVLLLANKQDLEGAMDEVDICEELSLEDVVNMNKCPCRIETCSAIRGTGKKMDPAIRTGMKWLCAMIEHNWDQLKERIDKDIKEAEIKQKAEMAARRERVLKQREEREKAEAEERRKLGMEEPQGDSDNDDVAVSGDPFKKLDMDELKKKEEQLKQEKIKKKELLRQKDKQEKDHSDNNSIDRFSAPRSNRSYGLLMNGDTVHHLSKSKDLQEGSEGEGSDSEVIMPRSSRLKPRLPPLQKPLGTKFVEDKQPSEGVSKKKKKKHKPHEKHTHHHHHHDHEKRVTTPPEQDDLQLDETANSLFGNTSKSLRSMSKIEVETLSTSSQEDIHHSEDDAETGEMHSPHYRKKIGVRKNPKLSYETGMKWSPGLRNSDDLERSGSEDDYDPPVYLSPKKNRSYHEEDEHHTSDTKVKKLKKKVRKNKTAPSDDEYELSEQKRDSESQDLPWIRSPNKTSGLQSNQSRGFRSANWGFAEDLPEIDIDSHHPRSRPNADDDDDILL